MDTHRQTDEMESIVNREVVIGVSIQKFVNYIVVFALKNQYYIHSGHRFVSWVEFFFLPHIHTLSSMLTPKCKASGPHVHKQIMYVLKSATILPKLITCFLLMQAGRLKLLFELVFCSLYYVISSPSLPWLWAIIGVKIYGDVIGWSRVMRSAKGATWFSWRCTPCIS